MSLSKIINFFFLRFNFPSFISHPAGNIIFFLSLLNGKYDERTIKKELCNATNFAVLTCNNITLFNFPRDLRNFVSYVIVVGMSVVRFVISNCVDCNFSRCCSLNETAEQVYGNFCINMTAEHSISIRTQSSSNGNS